jgi:hypothetical protein
VMGLVVTCVMCLFGEPVPKEAPVLDLVQTPLGGDSPLRLEDLRQGVCPVLRKLLKSVFNLGTAFCNENAANQVAMKPYVEWLSTLKGNKLNGSVMLTTIFKDNSALILDVEEAQIRRMFDLLSTHGLQMQFIDFLAQICSIHGRMAHEKQYLVRARQRQQMQLRPTLTTLAQPRASILTPHPTLSHGTHAINTSPILPPTTGCRVAVHALLVVHPSARVDTSQR